MLLALFLLHLPLLGLLGLPGWTCQGAADAPSPPPSICCMCGLSMQVLCPLRRGGGGLLEASLGEMNHPRGLWGLFPGHKGREGEAAV